MGIGTGRLPSVAAASRLGEVFYRFRILGARFLMALLLWQAGLAPLAHAAVFHSAPEAAGTERPATHPAGVAVVEAAPCHGDSPHESPVVAPPVVVHEHAGHEMPMADTVSTAPDCCDSLACQCACVHASLGGATFALMLPVIPDHPASLGTDTPALAARSAELFRPPI